MLQCVYNLLYFHFYVCSLKLYELIIAIIPIVKIVTTHCSNLLT